MPNLYATNKTSSTLTVTSCTVHFIDSADASLVTVYDGSDVPCDAFQYSLSGVPWWYVLDGVHDAWVDDLSSIGYHLPTPTLPTVTINDSWLVIGWSVSGNVTISANGTQDTKSYNDSEQLVFTVYDSTKVYAIVKAAKDPYAVVTRTGLQCENVNGTIGVRNVTSSSIQVYQAEYAYCDDSTATVVTVYDSSNTAYNAFKFTVSGTDYYYVLDGTQTDWTDDLAGIGYHFEDYIDVLLAMGWDTSNLQWRTVRFDYDPPYNWWYGCVISSSDVSILQNFGLTLSDGTDIGFQQGYFGANGALNYDSEYTFNVISLYSDIGETEVQTDLSRYSAEYNPQSRGSLLGIIRSGYDSTNLFKTWKCRITRNSPTTV